MNLYGLIGLLRYETGIDLNHLILIYHDVRFDVYYECPVEIPKKMRDNLLSEIFEQHTSAVKDMDMLETWFNEFLSIRWRFYEMDRDNADYDEYEPYQYETD
jgi:hypothetical protein